MGDVNKLFVSEKNLEKVIVKVEEEEFQFTLKKLSFMERNRILSECTSFQGTQMDINYAALIKRVLIACIVEAPFEVTEANIEKLSDEVGSQLESHLPFLKSFR